MLKELIYPFDPNYILENKKKIKKDLLDTNSDFVEKKIAILGGSTTAAVKQTLELFLLNNGIKPIFYESEFNKYYEDAIFGNELLDSFKPDVIYIYTTNRNINKFPELNDSYENINYLLENEYKKFESIWDNLNNKFNCPIIQNNFEMPFYRLMGNKEVNDYHGKINFINRLNEKIYEYSSNNKNFYICDINYISADYGLKKWLNPSYYYMYKYAINVNAIPYLSFNVSNIIKSIFGKNKKGFVLDLDNTLWGGVIGDDGVENIKIGPEEAIGESYLFFQKYLKEHEQLGIILSVDSKNDYDNAIRGLNHSNCILKEKDFVNIKANWESKDNNFINIANELNLLPESLVFIDDNPAEREIVEKQLSGVVAPSLKSSESFVEIIDRNGFFEVTNFSKDDLNRNKMYKENAERNKLQKSFKNYNDYLASLKMKAIIKPFDSLYYDRISELTNKSNQFNLTTKRYTNNEIASIAENKEYITLYGRLEDKFGDNGLVSVIIGHILNDTCHIDLWIMSCRVLKRELEFAMMDQLVKQCIENNIKEIKGYYYPTQKNSMVKEFYLTQGFNKIKEDSIGSEWVLSLEKKYENKNKIIEVNI